MTDKYIILYEPRLNTREFRDIISKLNLEVIKFNFFGKVLAKIKLNDRRSIEVIYSNFINEVNKIVNSCASKHFVEHCFVGNKVIFSLYNENGWFVKNKIGIITEVCSSTLTCKINANNNFYKVLCSNLYSFKKMDKPEHCFVGNKVMILGDPKDGKRWVPGKIISIDNTLQECHVRPDEFKNYIVHAPWNEVRPLDNQ